MRRAESRRGLGWALALMMLLGSEVSAQQRSLLGERPAPAGSDAYLRRQLRTLERAGTSPDGSGILLRRTRRDLISEGRGVFLSPEQARIGRELDRVGRDLQRKQVDADTARPLAQPRGERLPGTIDDAAALPSFRGSVTLGRLVGRAEGAMARGRPSQARSDIATARSLVDAVDPSSPADSRMLLELQARMTAVELMLAGGG